MGAFVQFERKKYEQQGLGLGIAIVKRLLAIYQGKMVVESIPTRSTTVTIEIPH
jgi:C4-dicarboxylate-specific signal transduction histidine kinase